MAADDLNTYKPMGERLGIDHQICIAHVNKWACNRFWDGCDLFIEWTKRVWEAAEGQVVEIDGKTVRRSADKAKGKSPIRMASAWATANGVELGQVKTDDRIRRSRPSPRGCL